MGKIIRRAEHQRDRFSTLRSILFIGLIVSLTGILFVRGDNPSPIGWNLSGGGFCNGIYTIFNTTLSPNPGLYAQNCRTGADDFFNATDIGFLLTKKVFPVSTGGLVSMRAGIYAAVTSIIFYSGSATWVGPEIILQGGGSAVAVGSLNPGVNGTVIIAKTNGMTVVKSTPTPSLSSGPHLNGNVLADLTISLGTTSNSVGVDWSCNEPCLLNKISHVGVDSSAATGTMIGYILSGLEDTCLCDSFSSMLDAVQWNSPSGNVVIIGGLYNRLTLGAQTVSVVSTTFSSMKFLGEGVTLGTVVSFENDYICNAADPFIINLNGQIIDVLKVSGSCVRSSGTSGFYSGTGTVKNAIFSANTWNFIGNPAWNTGGATLTKQTSDGSNHVTGGTITGFPFTIDGNGNF